MSKIKAISSTENFSENTIFHIAERFLTEHYDLRYNTIKQDIEYKPARSGIEWKPINENSLFLHLQKSNIKISINNLIAILKSDFVPRFNPFSSYYKSLSKWSEAEPDYIHELAAHVKTQKPAEFIEQFRKWIVRAVRCALDDNFSNQQAFILVDEKQQSGKSHFCRFLCPPDLTDYITENLAADIDYQLLATENLLINLDELASFQNIEINNFQSLLSVSKINLRLPYHEESSLLSKCSSFIGSTNATKFLSDEMNSQHWICYEISSIDWNYSKSIDINDVWKQAYALYLSDDFNYEMSHLEFYKNQISNDKFRVMTVN